MLYLIVLILFALITTEAIDYCSGQFEGNEWNCSPFEFHHLENTGQCTDSQKKTSGVFHGIQLDNCTTFYNISPLPDQTMSPDAIKMAQLITNVFENGGKSMGYAAVQQLGDCRGYTAGYIGFTTGTNDAYYVVKEYVKRNPNASLQTYLPELHRLSQFLFGDPARDDITHLTGFPEAWKEASCHDPVFDQTQLDVGESMYMRPAIKYAASVGIHSNLGKAIFYDTIIQHGWQYVEPLINLPRIIQLTGPKREKETEQAYLTRFLMTRRQLVCCYPSAVWNESADRMQDLQSIVDDWNQHQDLNHPVLLKIFNVEITGKENIMMDTEHCPKRSLKKRPASIRLPLPDTCTV